MKSAKTEKGLASMVTVNGEVYLFRALLMVNRAMLAGVSRLYGMPAARIGILRSVDMAAESGIGVVEISRELGLDAGAVTRHVSVLEKEGLVTRKGSLEDKRRVSIRLTEKGRTLIRQLYDYLRTVEKAMLAGVPSSDVEATLRVMEKVYSALKP